MTGWIILVLLAALLLAVLLYGIALYNGFVQMKNDADKAWSNIDLLLKQRYDELPKLVKVCEGYMQHEARTLEAVTRARALLAGATAPAEQLAAENAITAALRSLFAVVERYPELKADAGFRQLGTRISEIEDQIADRRELFNEYVNIYNVRIAQFPDLLIARLAGFAPRRLWQIVPEERRDVEIAFRPS